MSISGRYTQVGIVERNQQAHNEDADHVEYQNSPERHSYGVGYDNPRIPSFGSCYSHDLDVGIAVGRRDQRAPEAKELSRVARNKVCIEWAWILPVAEADSVSAR